MISNKTIEHNTFFVILIILLTLPFIIGFCRGKQSIHESSNSELCNEKDDPPALNYFKKTVYPEEAQKMRIEGEVLIEILVGVDGSAESVKVKESTDPIFNDAALTAAKDCRFKPAKRNNNPIKCRVAIPYHFKLHDY